VAPEAADRLLRGLGTNMRIFDGTLDEARISSVERILERIAERPDARCTTYGEFVGIADRFWREERDEPVDPVPALDRPSGVATLTGARVYSGALLSHLARSGASESTADKPGEDAAAFLREAGVSWDGCEVGAIEPSDPGAIGWLRRAGVRVKSLREPRPDGRAFDLLVWSAGFECCPPEKLSERLESAAAMLKPDGVLVLRVRTLGVRPGALRDGLPPLAELLFSKHERSASGESEPAEVVPWDAATFRAWLSAQGFELVRERRIPREEVELAAVARFSDKLGALDPEELRTSALEVILRKSSQMRGRPMGRSERESAHLTPSPESGDRAVQELAERFGPLPPGDRILAVGSEGSLRANAIPWLAPMVSRRQMLRKLKNRAPSTSAVTALDLDTWLGSAITPEAYDFIICSGLAQIELERLDLAADVIQRSLGPGGHLLVRTVAAPAPLASATTILVTLLRAGLEVIDSVPDSTFLDCRLVRPIDFAEIARFAGQA
jgi:SAM-dependent methyltransferase